MERRRTGQDRMEQASREFHERVAGGFTTFAGASWQRDHPECGPIVAIDASGSEQSVFDRLKAAVIEAWPVSFPQSAT
jgi:thymidylate kinase